jgi:hypothetical protein
VSRIDKVWNAYGPAGLEYTYVAICDCEPKVGESKTFLGSDFPVIWKLKKCGAEFRIADDSSCHPIPATCSKSGAAATTLTVTPGQTWSLEWIEVVTGEKPPAQECYCFGPPVDDCPIHGKGKANK